MALSPLLEFERVHSLLPFLGPALPPAGAPLGADPEAVALAALARGDTEATLAVLMQAYGVALYRYCRQLVVDEELAADVHQLTFVQAYEGLAAFAGRSSFRTWLFGIARHRCLDALKVLRRRQKRFQVMDELPETPDVRASVLDRLAAGALRQALRHCLEKLAPAVRDAVLLRYQEDLSYTEMSRLTRDQAATLQARVARALPVLRRCLESQGVSL